MLNDFRRFRGLLSDLSSQDCRIVPDFGLNETNLSTIPLPKFYRYLAAIFMSAKTVDNVDEALYVYHFLSKPHSIVGAIWRGVVFRNAIKLFEHFVWKWNLFDSIIWFQMFRNGN